MTTQNVTAITYGGVLTALCFLDYVLGNGVVESCRSSFCKVLCFVKRTWKEEARLAAQMSGKENPISFSVLLSEVIVLILTVLILHKYKKYRTKDRIDELLQESKEALRQTNEFLEKWRLRRINRQASTEDYSYLDEEPQEPQPLKMEVPILHMAIVDTLGSKRSQQERGDAGDSINLTDPTFLSMTSLVCGDDDDDEPLTLSGPEEKITEETKLIDFRNRYLWDVIEEDSNNMGDEED